MLNTIGRTMTKVTELPVLALWALVLSADLAALAGIWMLVDSLLFS